MQSGHQQRSHPQNRKTKESEPGTYEAKGGRCNIAEAYCVRACMHHVQVPILSLWYNLDSSNLVFRTPPQSYILFSHLICTIHKNGPTRCQIGRRFSSLQDNLK